MNNEELIDLELHEKAKETLIRLTDEYATAILYEARVMAYKSNQDQVQSIHIKQAANSANNKAKTKWSSELFKIIGSAFIGVFIPGFVTTILSTTISSTFLIIYTILGFLGLVLLFLGLRKI